MAHSFSPQTLWKSFPHNSVRTFFTRRVAMCTMDYVTHVLFRNRWEAVNCINDYMMGIVGGLYVSPRITGITLVCVVACASRFSKPPYYLLASSWDTAHFFVARRGTAARRAMPPAKGISRNLVSALASHLSHGTLEYLGLALVQQPPLLIAALAKRVSSTHNSHHQPAVQKRSQLSCGANAAAARVLLLVFFLRYCG